MANKSFVLATTLGCAFGLGVLVAGPARAAFGCDDESGLCLEPVDGAAWTPDERCSDAERKKRNTKTPGTLSLVVDGGRGSIFINGRFAGTAPLEDIEIPSGPNDVQVRDGATVLATGVLTVPKEAGVSLTVRHD
jgi:hypothetical protein